MRKQWVFFEACGCPFGALEDAGYSKAEAWAEFYDTGRRAGTERAIGGAVARGVTTERMDHTVYVAQIMPKMHSSYTCPHELTATTALPL